MNKKTYIDLKLVAFIFLALAFLFMFSIFTKADFNTKLYSVWKFDNNCTDMISTGGQDDCTLSSATYNNSDSKDGSHNLNCDGVNDYAYMTNTNNEYTYLGSFSFWIQVNADDSADNSVINVWDSSSPEVRWGIDDLNDDLDIAFHGSQIGAESGWLEIDDSTPYDTWKHIVVTSDSNGYVDVYLNGNNVTQFDTGGWAGDNTETLELCKYSDNAYGYTMTSIDELYWWNRSLNSSEVSELYNSGTGLFYPFADGGGADVTPPSITNINRNPSNLTVLNALEENWEINATITDETALNTSSIILNITLEQIEVFVNGELLNEKHYTESYNHSSGNVFTWVLDENSYLSGTHNINHEEFEIQPILNATMDSSNKWVKIRYLNVSNDKKLVFNEIMDSNTTGIAEYYYCNDNYSSGNPVSSEWCTIFYTQTDDDNLHIHGGNTWHRVMPMGINTSDGKLNEIIVTELSYILKRGSSEEETYFYIANDTSSTETSNNNGNAWTSQTYTVNGHIHQIDENETFIFQVCAEDNSSNKACSSNETDVIDFPTLPPTTVRFLTPELYEEYNGTIEIHHTQSFSQTGQDIINYTLEYKINTSTSWDEIIVNEYPKTTYDWDISEIANGNYNLRVTVRDSLGLTSVTVSPEFLIDNPLTLNTQLLTSIDETLTSITVLINDILEGTIMLGLIILFVALIIFAFAFRVYIILSFNGVISFLIAMSSYNRVTTTNYFYQAMVWIFLFLAFGLFFMGILLQIMYNVEIKKANKNSFYSR